MTAELRDAVKFVAIVLIGFGIFSLVGLYFPTWAIWVTYILALVVMFPTFLQAEALIPYGFLVLIWFVAVTLGVA